MCQCLLCSEPEQPKSSEAAAAPPSTAPAPKLLADKKKERYTMFSPQPHTGFLTLFAKLFAYPNSQIMPNSSIFSLPLSFAILIWMQKVPILALTIKCLINVYFAVNQNSRNLPKHRQLCLALHLPQNPSRTRRKMWTKSSKKWRPSMTSSRNTRGCLWKVGPASLWPWLPHPARSTCVQVR